MVTLPTLDASSNLPLHEPFSRATALAAGVSDYQLRTLVGEGYLRRPVAGLYVASHVPDSIELRCRLLSLVVPDDCFVCDRTAAWLYAGARALGPNEHLSVPAISCFRPSDAGRLRNTITNSGERAIAPRDLRVVHGLLATTPLRTALDLGRLERTRDLRLHGMDTMLSLGQFTLDELLAEVPRFKRQRGVVMLRVLAPLADGGSESFGESALRLRWHDAAIPRPRTQIPIMVGDIEVARVDMGIEELLLGGEYDGEEWHSDEDQQRHDDERRRFLDEGRGWSIEVFRKEDVFGHHQDADRRLRAAYVEARRTLGERTFII